MHQNAHSATVEFLVEKLVAALSERGLSADPVGTNLVWAVNRAADPTGGDPLAAVRSPGLRQTVLCREDEDGELLWWWVWSGATRDAPPEHEPLGPAKDVGAAADRIARVLSLATP